MEKKARHATSYHTLHQLYLFGGLFALLIAIALITVSFLPRLNPDYVQASNTINVPNLIANCAYFYQLCPTTSEGGTTPTSVEEHLIQLNSPLAEAELLLYSEFDSEVSRFEHPSQIVTSVASKHNLNPFLLLTLLEMEQQLVTQSVDLKPVIESAGENSREAWFAIQQQLIATDLKQLEQANNFHPTDIQKKGKLKSLTINGRVVKVTGNYSLATQLLVEHIAKKSNSVQDLQTQFATFTHTYQQLWGIDPSDSATLQ
jgi:hypothetical protein